jgi:hypothetical protein
MTFSAPPLSKRYIKGMCPLLFQEFEGAAAFLIAKKTLDM